jgi:hypothetical protein
LEEKQGATIMPKRAAIIPGDRIERSILLIRGLKVILDKDLAILYGVTTSNLNKAVSRNIDRFPEDFMLQLTGAEFTNLKFHFGTSSWGGTRKPPRAFTEQGIAMLSSVLRSPRAVKVNIEIMRAFVRLRDSLAGHKGLSSKLSELERRVASHDKSIQSIFEAIRQLIQKPLDKKRQIGFRAIDKDKDRHD